jgi:hypothetical protein
MIIMGSRSHHQIRSRENYYCVGIETNFVRILIRKKGNCFTRTCLSVMSRLWAKIEYRVDCYVIYERILIKR